VSGCQNDTKSSDCKNSQVSGAGRDNDGFEQLDAVGLLSNKLRANVRIELLWTNLRYTNICFSKYINY
jgi:hypothetical protein